MKAVVPYFGAKRTLAPLIVRELGEHRSYYEPFCGSCAVLLAKPPSRMEHVNDLNGALVNLVRCIQHPELGPKLYRRLRRMLMVETLWREAADRWKARGRQRVPETPDLEAAVDYFYASWSGRNGVVGTSNYNYAFAVRYTGGGGHAGSRWRSAVDSIPAWRRRMRDVVVLNRDGLELTERIEDEEGTAIYLDPPYLVKGARYIHDFAPDDHRRLAEAAARFRRARVVVSYYAHPLLDDLYPRDRWTHRHVPVNKSLLSGNGRNRESAGPVVAPEVLLINGPSLAGGTLFGPTDLDTEMPDDCSDLACD